MPERSISRWLITSASAGVSLTVAMRNWLARIFRLPVNLDRIKERTYFMGLAPQVLAPRIKRLGCDCRIHLYLCEESFDFVDLVFIEYRNTFVNQLLRRNSSAADRQTTERTTRYRTIAARWAARFHQRYYTAALLGELKG